MRIEVGVATDIGRVRERNEDSYLVEPPLYAVADGMGGARGGAVASGLALDTVDRLFRKHKGSLLEQVREANRVVFQRSMTDRSVSGMGTTLTAAMVEGDSAQLAHVGDSRAYLLRAGSLRRLTDDHTLVNRMVRTGEITAEEAEVHPHRNILTRVLGTEPDVSIDEKVVPLLDGDQLVLCSDGLFGMVPEEQIQAILESTTTPQEAADRLVKTANRAGGVDNITVLVIDIHGNGGDAEAKVSDRRPSSQRTRTAPGAGRRPRPSARTVRRLAMWLAVVAVLVGAGIVAMRWYLDRQWYVGESGGKVAVFQGIPAELAGIQFSHVEIETDLSADKVSALSLYRNLPDGITANGRDEALAIVDQMRADVRTAAKRGGGP